MNHLFSFPKNIPFKPSETALAVIVLIWQIQNYRGIQ